MGAAESVALATGSVGLQLGIRACFTTIRPLVILGVFLKIVLVNMKAEHSGPSELGVPLRPSSGTPGPQDFVEIEAKHTGLELVWVPGTRRIFGQYCPAPTPT